MQMTNPIEQSEPGRIRVLLRSIWHWDFICSFAAGITLSIALYGTQAPLPIHGTALFAAAVPLGMAAIAAVVTSLRWASDRLKDAHVGQMMRLIDPSEARFILPYTLVIVSGCLTSLVGVLGVILGEAVAYEWLVCLYSILLFLVLYDFLGMFSLISLGKRIQTMHSRLQADKEHIARLERELKDGAKSPPNSSPKGPTNGTERNEGQNRTP